MKYKFNPMLGPRSKYPVGSPEWSERVSLGLQSAVGRAEQFGVDHLLEELKQVMEGKPWLVFPEDNPVLDMNKYFKLVTGHHWPAIRLLIEEFDPDFDLTPFDKSVADYAKNVESLTKHAIHGGDKKSENIVLDKIGIVKYDNSGQGGNSKKYRIAKLKRDFPEIADRLMDGEFKNVAQAEREAGIGRPLLTPLERLSNMFNKLSDTDKEAFKLLNY